MRQTERPTRAEISATMAQHTPRWNIARFEASVPDIRRRIRARIIRDAKRECVEDVRKIRAGQMAEDIRDDLFWDHKFRHRNYPGYME